MSLICQIRRCLSPKCRARNGIGGEGLDDLPVDVALEGHDQVHQLVKRHPPPGVELDLVAGRRGDRNLAVGAEEARGKPLLLLAAVLAAPGLAEEVTRQLIA